MNDYPHIIRWRRIAFRSTAACGLVLFLDSCDEVTYQVDKARFRGTHMAVAACTARFTDPSLDESAVKSACIRRNESTKTSRLDGGLSFASDESVKIRACNIGANIVVTRLNIYVKYGAHNAVLDVVDRGAFAGNEPLWIAPHDCADIYIEELLNPRPSRAEAAGVSNYFSWSVGKIYGVTVYAD